MLCVSYGAFPHRFSQLPSQYIFTRRDVLITGTTFSSRFRQIAFCATLAEALLATRNLSSYTPILACAAHNMRRSHYRGTDHVLSSIQSSPLHNYTFTRVCLNLEKELSKLV